MAKKEFTFRGKELEELKKLSIEEFATLLPARQRRSIQRGFTDEKKKFLKKVAKKDNVKTHLRTMIVFPSMVGKIIKIYNGKEFTPVIIQEEMIGCFFGELSLTRRKVGHNAPGIGATKSSSNVSVK
ncbi:30S ribosomal protein S19 [Candidatus Woesearchaeota archaeon]|nr:MAG: 30S ribosomal protein S19 [Candidatus Woesearchaeota archaeon]